MCSSSAPAPPPAPDYSGIAAANEASARYAKEAADNDLAFRKQVYSDSLPRQQQLQDLASQIAQKQVGMMDQQSNAARDSMDYYNKTYKPIEQFSALESMGGLNMNDSQLAAMAQQLGIDPAQMQTMMSGVRASNEAKVMQAQQQAMASSNSAFGQAQRNLSRMGGDPNRLANAAATLANQQTLAQTGAMNNARTQAEAQGTSLRAGTAAFGRNMPNTAGQMYGLANNSGNSSVGNQNTGFMSGLPYAQFASGGVGNQLGAAGLGIQSQLGLGGLMNNAYGAQLNYSANMANQGGGGLGALLGAGAQLGSAYMMSPYMASDRRLKDNIAFVGKDLATGLNLYEFSYIEDPEHRYRGVMADEVVEQFPDAVVHDKDGYAMVNYGKLGFPMVEV